MIAKNVFNWHSTADQVVKGIDLSGKLIFITGTTNGIGKESVRALAKCNPSAIWMACRNVKASESVASEISSETGYKNIFSVECDLSSLASVRSSVQVFNQKTNKAAVHVLINNAGLMALPKLEKTQEGFEMQIGVNHIGHFYLTMLLLPNLRSAKGSRVVNVSSSAHRMSDIHWKDIVYEDPGTSYWPWSAYGQSKTANILFTVELAKRFANDKDQIYSNSLHPGAVRTNLASNLGGGSKFFFAMLAPFKKFFFKSAEQGAATQTYVATSPDLEKQSGLFFDSCQVSTPKQYAVDSDLAAKLWEFTETCIKNKGFSFDV